MFLVEPGHRHVGVAIASRFPQATSSKQDNSDGTPSEKCVGTSFAMQLLELPFQLCDVHVVLHRSRSEGVGNFAGDITAEPSSTAGLWIVAARWTSLGLSPATSTPWLLFRCRKAASIMCDGVE